MNSDMQIPPKQQNQLPNIAALAGRQQRGFVLVSVMTLIPLFLMLSLTGAYTAQMELRMATNEMFAVRALGVAEAGIDHAADLLQTGSANGFNDELSGGGTGGSLASIGSTVTLADGNTYRFRSFGGAASDGYYVRIEDNYDEVIGTNVPTADTDERVLVIVVGRVNSAERKIEAGVGVDAADVCCEIASWREIR